MSASLSYTSLASARRIELATFHRSRVSSVSGVHIWRERVRRLDLPIPSVFELKKQAKNAQKEGRNDAF